MTEFRREKGALRLFVSQIGCRIREYAAMTPILLPNVTDFYQYSAAETAEAPANIVLFICGNPGMFPPRSLSL